MYQSIQKSFLGHKDIFESINIRVIVKISIDVQVVLDKMEAWDYNLKMIE